MVVAALCTEDGVTMVEDSGESTLVVYDRPIVEEKITIIIATI